MGINKRGFTLMEIMIVVSITVILITLAVPNILRSRVTANEAAAIANLKVLNNACQLYHLNSQQYPDTLNDLSSGQSPYVDSAMGSGQKQGYNFTYASIDTDHFTVNADPAHAGLLRGRYFYLDESGVIRGRRDAPAGSDDEIVQQ